MIVLSVNHLRDILSENNTGDNTGEFFTLMNFGVKVSKIIKYDKNSDAFTVLCCLSGTKRSIKAEQIEKEENNIISAIKNGIFYFRRYCEWQEQ